MIDGFVLAGGRSSRMGSDKARLPFPDRWPMAVHVALAMRAVCDRVAIVRRFDDGPFLAPDGTRLPVIFEADEGSPHPLWGLATACAHGRTPFVAVASCDVPHFPPEGWKRLLAALPVGVGGDSEATPEGAVAGAVVAAHGPDRHPLIGIWPRAVGPAAALAARRGIPARFFSEHAAAVDLPAPWLANVNAPIDLGSGSGR